MNKYILAIILLSAWGCTISEVHDEVSDSIMMSLNVVTEQIPETRSLIDYDGSYHWSINDHIGVYGSITENARFYFESQSEEFANFIGSLASSDDTPNFAYYPYQTGAELLDNKFSFNIPAQISLTNENHSPMVGQINDNTLCFRHIGGGIHLRFAGLDNTASKIIIKSQDETDPFLSGNAELDDINSGNYKIKDGQHHVSCDIIDCIEGDTFFSIYIPLQVGKYSKLTVEVLNKNNETICEKSLSNISIYRTCMITPPVIHMSSHTYAYPLPEDWYDSTSWDGAVFFSNDLLMMYQDERINGGYYVFSDLHTFNSGTNSNNLIILKVDDLNNITAMHAGNIMYEFTYNNDNSFNVVVTDGDSQYSYTNVSIPGLEIMSHNGWTPNQYGIHTKANVQNSNIAVLNNLHNILNGNFIRDNTSAQNTQDSIHDLNQIEVLEQVAQDYYSSTGAANPIASIRLAASIIAYEVKTINQAQYASVCGNAYVALNKIERLSDNKAQIRISLINQEEINQGAYSDSWGVECGVLVIEESINSNYPSQMLINSRNVKILASWDYQNNSNITTLSLEEGKRYYVRGYLGFKYGQLDLYTYSEIRYIDYDGIELEDFSVSPGVFTNGQFYFKVTATGSCQSDTQINYMVLEETLYQERAPIIKQWSKYNNIVYYDLYLNQDEMSYKYMGASGIWKLFCSQNSQDREHGTSIPLYYDQQPQIDLSVKIISGPTPISKTKSDNEEEELYYIIYEVVVETHGSGWMRSIYTSSSDGNLSRSEVPSNDTHTFIYRGSATYKDKSELPVIRSESRLIDNSKIDANQVISLSSLI